MSDVITPKEYLLQGYRLKERIRMHQSEIEELRSLATSVGSPGFEPHYNSNPSTKAPFERLLYKIYDMEAEHTKMLDKLLTFKKEATEAINKIPNQDERLILLYRYIKNWSFADIGEKLNVDRHTAMRVRGGIATSLDCVGRQAAGSCIHRKWFGFLLDDG